MTPSSAYLMIDVINDHAPLSEKRVKLERQPPWMKPEILSAMKNRDYLLQKSVKIPGKSNRNTEEWRLSTVQRLTECCGKLTEVKGSIT